MEGRGECRTRMGALLVALAAALVAVALVPARALAAAGFPDVADDAWYAQAVTWAHDNGVMNGYADGRFGPEDALLREQSAAVFYNYLGGSDKEAAPATTLRDVVQSEWYAKPVNWAVSSGTMHGYDGGERFGVGDTLTREQLAVVMARVCKADLSKVDTTKFDALHDHGSTSDWAEASVAWAVQNGVVNGFAEADGTRTLAPQGTVTRAQMAGVMMNAVTGGVLRRDEAKPGDGEKDDSKADSSHKDKSGKETTKDSDDTHEVGGHEVWYTFPSEDHIATDSATGTRFVDNEVLVTANEGVAEDEAELAIAAAGGTVVGRIEVTRDYQVRLGSPETLSGIESIVAELKASGLFEEVEPNYVSLASSSMIPNDEEWKKKWDVGNPGGDNWGAEAIDAPGAWDYYDEMTTVKVGVLDSGFAEHPDLRYARIWPDAGWANAEKVHGTHVSGIIGALFNNKEGVAGIAPKVRLYGYADAANKTIKDGSWDLPVGEVKYAVALLLQSGCRVINCSQSSINEEPVFSESRDALGSFLERYLDAGYDFVIAKAAGNAGDDVKDTHDWMFSNLSQKRVRDRVIVVGSVGNDENATGTSTSRYKYAEDSNYGDSVDIVAPGVKIESTVPIRSADYPDSSYGTKSGTSMAAPHVAGVAAMCFSVNPSLTGAQVKDIIVQASRSGGTVEHVEPSGTRSYPMLNAKLSVRSATAAVGKSGEVDATRLATVMGRIVDEDGETPIEDAWVGIYRVSDSYDPSDPSEDGGDYVGSVRTGSDGGFDFLVKPGSYRLGSYVDGYYSIDRGPITDDNPTGYVGKVGVIKVTANEVKDIETIALVKIEDPAPEDPDEPTEEATPISDVYAVLYSDGELVLSSDDSVEEGREVLGKGSFLEEAVSSGATGLYKECKQSAKKITCTIDVVVDDKNDNALASMFQGWKALEDISGLSRWDVSEGVNSKDCGHMFKGCTALANLSPLVGWDMSDVVNVTGMFSGCTALTDVSPLGGWDLSRVYDMADMFSGCTSLEAADLSAWGAHFGEVHDTSDVFNGCTSLKSVNLLDWDTSSVADMGGMFEGCTSLESANVYNWDTSNVSDMKDMFRECSSLINLPGAAGWDTSSLKNSAYMFYNCSSLESLDLGKWDVSKVETMDGMFEKCTSLRSLDISGWHPEAVTNMIGMFMQCNNLADLEIADDWDCSKAYGYGLEQMFNGCSSLKELNLSNWNVSPCTSMIYTFYGCSSLKSLDLSNWNTSNLKDLGGTFFGCTSLSDLKVSGWDISSVTNLGGTFWGCSSLSDPGVSKWDVSSVTYMSATFRDCDSITSIDLSSWDVSKVTDMRNMFYDCDSLRSVDLSGWDVSSVKTMSCMFYSCQNLSGISSLFDWNVSSETSTGGMFAYTSVSGFPSWYEA